MDQRIGQSERQPALFEHTHMTTIEVNPTVALCVEQARQHEQLAADALTDEERRAHEATMRSLDKAALEMVKGNAPRYAGFGVWLVESRTQANVVYRVDLQRQTCTCKNGRTCWHLSAANVCEELRSMPADALPAVTMSDDALDEAAIAYTMHGGTPDDINAFDWEALAAAQ